jgi:hypothetical protein
LTHGRERSGSDPDQPEAANSPIAERLERGLSWKRLAGEVVTAGVRASGRHKNLRGIPVLPVDSDTKRPLTVHGVSDATTDVSVIDSWRRSWPCAGVAVATGRVSGLVVIDVDPRNGGDQGIADAASELGALPRTTVVSTPSGGWHYWFSIPIGITIANTVGKLAAGVDIRGERGYVVAPPTRIRSGAAWSWAVGAPLAMLPDRWAAALTRTSRGRQQARADEWVSMLDPGVRSGERNHSLTRFVGHLLSRDVDARVVLEIAYAVNEARFAPPLARPEVQRIVESISGRELRKRIGAQR